MEKLIINGGKSLSGEIEIQGSKNAALPILAASLLLEGRVRLKNVPRLLDVENMLEIIRSLGVFAFQDENNVYLCADGMDSHVIDKELAKELRSSIFLLGAVLSRKKQAVVSYPGGCDIGLRPIDIHLKALRDLGVRTEEKGGYVYCDAKNFKPGDVFLDYPSVGATENIILTAVKEEGITIIHNAAREPEIVELVSFLNQAGGKIAGAGTTKICIIGNKTLKNIDYTISPDRIVTGTFLFATLMTQGKVGFKCGKKQEFISLLRNLPKSSCKITYDNDIIYVQSNGRLPAVEKISTRPYPGFPTDLQAPFMALESISDGTCVLTETIFENRFRHVPELRKMGADILIQDRTAVIKGVHELFGAEVYARDLRGGASLVLAGLAAKGITVVKNVYHIDRGYEKIENTLKKLGADIHRE